MKLNIAVTAIAIAALVSVATEAQAQTTIYGCYVKNSGTVYRIKAPNTPTKCSGNATEFSWNLEGQVGPQGPQGPQGLQGPSGWPGVIRLDGLAYVQPGQNAAVTVGCGAGKQILSGGYIASNQPAGFQITGSMPHYVDEGAESQHGWTVYFANSSPSQVVVSIYALCRRAD